MTQYRHGYEINQSKYLRDEIKWNGGIIPCFVQQVSHNKIEIDLIRKYADKFKKPKILHIGCGKAFDSIYLSYFYDNIEAIDIGGDIVKLAEECNKLLHGRLLIHQQDAFDIQGRYNIIFLDSVSEYMPHDKTLELVKKCCEIADYVIISTATYQAKKYRIMNPHTYTTLKEWKERIRKSDGKIIEIYGIQYPIRIMNMARHYPPLAKLFPRFARILFMVVKKNKWIA